MCLEVRRGGDQIAGQAASEEVPGEQDVSTRAAAEW